MADWIETTLGEVADLLTGFPFKSKEYTEDPEGVRLLRGDNIAQGRLEWEQAKRWPQSQRANFEEYELKEGDVVLAMDRPWIEAGLKRSRVQRGDTPSLLVQRVSRLRARGSLDQRFLGFLIDSPAFTSYIRSVQTGTAVPHISGGQIRQYRFRLPTQPVQERIADILGSLDDKIEVNRKMNRTLEAMAQALYRHWFVDFGPFQDGAFVDSELGQIPVGWRVKPLREVARMLMGQSPPSKFYNSVEEGLPFHQGVTHFGFRFPTHEKYCTELNRVAAPGSILFSVRAPVGRINVADRELVIGRGIAAMNHREGHNSYLLHQLKHHFREEDTVGSGTIFNAVTKRELENYKLIAPPDEVVSRLERLFRPLDEQVAQNEQETLRLAEARDYLLPKLLSGEVEAQAAEEIVEAIS